MLIAAGGTLTSDQALAVIRSNFKYERNIPQSNFSSNPSRLNLSQHPRNPSDGIAVVAPTTACPPDSSRSHAACNGPQTSSSPAPSGLSRQHSVNGEVTNCKDVEETKLSSAELQRQHSDCPDKSDADYDDISEHSRTSISLSRQDSRAQRYASSHSRHLSVDESSSHDISPRPRYSSMNSAPARTAHSHSRSVDGHMAAATDTLSAYPGRRPSSEFSFPPKHSDSGRLSADTSRRSAANRRPSSSYPSGGKQFRTATSCSAFNYPVKNPEELLLRQQQQHLEQHHSPPLSSPSHLPPHYVDNLELHRQAAMQWQGQQQELAAMNSPPLLKGYNMKGLAMPHLQQPDPLQMLSPDFLSQRLLISQSSTDNMPQDFSMGRLSQNYDPGGT